MSIVAVLILFNAIFVTTAVICVVEPIRERRVSSRIRVAQLRHALANVEPGAEIVIRPAASWSLSVEMIVEVAADEGFRFRRDTVTSVGQRSYPAMVFASTTSDEHDA